jgi:YesN/AraC family two-component response regulator
METVMQTERSSSRARILVAEDEDDLRLTLCDWLMLRGYAVKGARDGLEALELASREAFDVVLTDLKMPRCDGLRLLDGLKTLAPNVAVIFMSGQATLSDTIEALREGRSFDFLQKPFHDLRHVSDVVDRALNCRAAQHPETFPPPRWKMLPPAVAEAIEDEPILQQAFRFIEAHYQAPIGLNDVADATRHRPSELATRMRRATGRTVQQWIVAFKMQESQQLLAATTWPIQHIAATLGYIDPATFQRHFRRAFGMMPEAWRQRPSRQE